MNVCSCLHIKVFCLILIYMNRYTLKIYPKGAGREVYRVVLVDGKLSLDEFASLILDLFDFDHEHLYEFCMSGKLYDRGGLNYICDDDYGFGRPTEGVTIDQLKLKKGQKFLFHYDFGDDWQFIINVQQTESTDSELKTSYEVLKERGGILQVMFDDDFADWDEEDE